MLLPKSPSIKREDVHSWYEGVLWVTTTYRAPYTIHLRHSGATASPWVILHQVGNLRSRERCPVPASSSTHAWCSHWASRERCYVSASTSTPTWQGTTTIMYKNRRLNNISHMLDTHIKNTEQLFKKCLHLTLVPYRGKSQYLQWIILVSLLNILERTLHLWKQIWVLMMMSIYLLYLLINFIDWLCWFILLILLIDLIDWLIQFVCLIDFIGLFGCLIWLICLIDLSDWFDWLID